MVANHHGKKRKLNTVSSFTKIDIMVEAHVIADGRW